MLIDGPIEAPGSSRRIGRVCGQTPSMLIDGPIEAAAARRIRFDPDVRLRRCSSTAPLKHGGQQLLTADADGDSVDAHRRPH